MSSFAPEQTDVSHRKLLVSSICSAAAAIVATNPNGAAITRTVIEQSAGLVLPLLSGITDAEKTEIDNMLTGVDLAFDALQPYLGDTAVTHLVRATAAHLSADDVTVMDVLSTGPLSPTKIRERVARDHGITMDAARTARILSRLRLAALVDETRHGTFRIQELTAHGQAVHNVRRTPVSG